jgi:hypothetical protein
MFDENWLAKLLMKSADWLNNCLLIFLQVKRKRFFLQTHFTIFEISYDTKSEQ